MRSPFTEADWHDSIATEGTQSNTIFTENDSPLFGSAPNPIVIYEDWYHKIDKISSDTDTEIMTIPEFWDALTDKIFPDSVDESEAVASALIYNLTSYDPEDLRIGELPTNNPYSNEKTPETSDDPSLEL